MSRPPKSVETIIDAVLPEPDFDDAHDGRFTGYYDRDTGVVSIKFERSDPGMDPEECDEYDVPDEGDGSVQLVEREALIRALARSSWHPEEYWRQTIGRILFEGAS